MQKKKKVKAWMSTPEGKVSIKKALQKAHETSQHLHEAAKVDPETLRRPFDI